MFWCEPSLKSQIASELRIPGFGFPQLRLRNSTPGAQGGASCSILATSLVCFVFAVG